MTTPRLAPPMRAAAPAAGAAGGGVMRRIGRRAAGAGAAALVGAALAAPAGLLAPLDAGGTTPAAPWHVIGFPFKTKPLTRFDIVDIDGQRAVRVEADQSYGILTHPLPGIGGDAHRLSWRWRVDVPNDKADLRERSGDDVAAEVCVGFDLPLDRVPFVERQALRVARMASKDVIPAAEVCYVWDSHLPTGTAIDSVFTRRVRMIVVRGAGTPVAAWRSETRDVDADFLRLFGDEAKEVPPIIAVAVAGDADNTRAHTVAYVADVVLANR
ncbi:MAG TPA: DUF3047 domain-containing protein [Rubrivivax sp.]|nr:DUF3047 domain-containing protein [Rubrivivax sp.]HPO18317.1 DUF3047 domain-containing protein [Rubrivivax sp.]